MGYTLFVQTCFPDVDSFQTFSQQIAHYLGDKMASKGNEKLTDDFLILIRHPPQCSSMLKVSMGLSILAENKM